MGEDNKYDIERLGYCHYWFNRLNVNTWSKYAYYPACKALCETSVVIKANYNDRLVIALRFKKPEVELIPKNDPRYVAASKLASYYPPETYIPDLLGFYLPHDIVVEDVVLNHGIYIHVNRIIEYWKRRLSDQVFFNVNTLLALVFYHEYFHMIMDKLGISYFYQDKEGFEINHEYHSYINYEEALAEFYALSNTLFDSLLLDSWGYDLGRSICDPVKNINSRIRVSEEFYVEVDETIAYQPVSCIKFISLDRSHPYSLVKELWKDYLFVELISKLIKYSVYTDLDINPVKALNTVARIHLVNDPHEFLYKEVGKLLKGMKHSNSMRKGEVDVYVYLLGVDQGEIVEMSFTCSDLA